MNYKISKYNNNGYHDSYWGVVVWDSEKKEVRKIQTGTTAGYQTEHEAYENYLPESELPAIRKYFRDEYFKHLVDQKEQITVVYYSYDSGEKVEAARTFRHKGKSYQKGTKFVVLGSTHFGGDYHSMRLQMEDGSQIYTSAKNLKFSYTVREMMKKSVQVAENKMSAITYKGAA